MNRRRFLAHSAGAVAAGSLLPRFALAASAPQAAPAASTLYVPGPKPTPVVKTGEFIFAAAHLDHGHINGQCSALIEAGATLKWVYEPDAKKRDDFLRRFKQAKAARALDEILVDSEVKLVTGAAVTSERGPLGCKVMEAGKDYFTDKAPFTTLEQLAKAKTVAARTGRKYMVYYSERLGYLELREYVDVARERKGDHVYLVDDKGEHHIPVAGKVGLRFFGELILDCLNRTEKAMKQAHAFKAAELCLKAQAAARQLT